MREQLLRAARDRSAAALVATPDIVAEVSVAPGGRWVVRSYTIEWVGGPVGLECWEVLSAGARQITHNKPPEWVHPAVGVLWPHLLPIWGRVGDSHRPDRIIEGVSGPGQIVLGAVDAVADAHDADATLTLDPARWLCLSLELPGRTWTLQEYRDTRPRSRYG